VKIVHINDNYKSSCSYLNEQTATIAVDTELLYIYWQIMLHKVF